MIALPPRATDVGAETRLLLSECRGPSFAGYNLIDATSCMQLMDLVLSNRIDNPKPFLAKHDTLLGVITAPGQFEGFQHYPHYSNAIVHNIQQLVDIANRVKDQRAARFAEFITTAIRIATVATIPDPSPGSLVAWRTAGSGSPGAAFTFFKTILGTSFYYIAADSSKTE
jgi:hypothetical protein